MEPGQVGLIVHGTTLATNAIIERKGAQTALVTTQGFRDSIEMAQENRFEQYDIFIEKPEPLVPRTLRFTVPERIDAKGGVRLALDEAAVEALAATLKAKERRGRRHRLPAQLRQSRARAAHGRDPGRSSCPACASRCRARSAPRCASTSASRRPAPTPMCSR